MNEEKSEAFFSFLDQIASCCKWFCGFRSGKYGKLEEPMKT
jgi:hypothetical protein